MDDIIFTLTDTAGGIEIADWTISSGELGLKGDTPFEIAKRTLHGGRQEGSTLLTIRAGRLAVIVIPTRGMGILKASLDGVDFGWASPIDEVVHPAFIRLGERNGLGWLDGFNELMVRCGYEWTGHPGEEALAFDGTIKDGVADDDVARRVALELRCRAHDDAATRQALADVIVTLANQVDGDSLRQEGTKALSGGPAQLDLDGVVRQSSVTVLLSDAT